MENNTWQKTNYGYYISTGSNNWIDSETYTFHNEWRKSVLLDYIKYMGLQTDGNYVWKIQRKDINRKNEVMNKINVL